MDITVISMITCFILNVKVISDFITDPPYFNLPLNLKFLQRPFLQSLELISYITTYFPRISIPTFLLWSYKNTYKRLAMLLFLIVISGSPIFTQPIGIGSETIPGLFDTQITNHQGHRFGETMFSELMNPNLYPMSTRINQNHELNQGFQSFITYGAPNNQHVRPDLINMSWSLPIFNDQLVEIALTSPIEIQGGQQVYQIGIPLETPEVFWPVIDDINKNRNMVFILTMDEAWEKLSTGRISRLLTSAQSLISWYLTQDCTTLDQHQVTTMGPIMQGHFVSLHSQLIAQINLGIRLLGASSKIEELGDHFYSSENSLCGQPILFDFFITY
jgi:hypothetical protein